MIQTLTQATAKSKVVIKPIVKKTAWHKLHELNRTRFNGTHETIQALPDRHTGVLATGLTNDEERIKLERALGVDLSPNSSNKFWQEFAVRLGDETVELDPSNPRQLVTLRLLQASKMVANSQKELDEGKWPSAKFLIYDEEEEVEKESEEYSREAEAITTFVEMGLEDRKKVLKLFGKRVDDKSDKFIYNQLFKIVKDSKTTLEFMKYALMDREELAVRSMIADLEFAGILRKEGTAYKYNDQRVGFDYEDTVNYLLNPKNHELKAKFKTDLEARGILKSGGSTPPPSIKKGSSKKKETEEE